MQLQLYEQRYFAFISVTYDSDTLLKVGKIFSAVGKLIIVFGFVIKFYFPAVAAMIGF